MAEQRPVIVAGAGIGGLTAALALHQQGVPVEVLERRQNRTIALAGTGMTIWSNATTALGHLGLERQLRENGAVIRRAVHHSERDEVMFSTDVEGCEWPGSVPSLSVARGALVSTLLEACEDRGIPVHFGRQVTGATPAGVLVGGEFVGARAVIGADGARSVLRQGLVGGQARYYGITVWRGLSEARDSIEDGVAHMFQTQRRSGLAGMAWRIGDGRVAWTIGIKTAEGGTTADPRQTVLDLLEGVKGPPREWVRATPADGVIRVDLFELPWQEQWGAGRVTLIGDAAHAMPTVLGRERARPSRTASRWRGSSAVPTGTSNRHCAPTNANGSNGSDGCARRSTSCPGCRRSATRCWYGCATLRAVRWRPGSSRRCGARCCAHRLRCRTCAPRRDHPQVGTRSGTQNRAVRCGLPRDRRCSRVDVTQSDRW